MPATLGAARPGRQRQPASRSPAPVDGPVGGLGKTRRDLGGQAAVDSAVDSARSGRDRTGRDRLLTCTNVIHRLCGEIPGHNGARVRAREVAARARGRGAPQRPPAAYGQRLPRRRAHRGPDPGVVLPGRGAPLGRGHGRAAAGPGEPPQGAVPGPGTPRRGAVPAVSRRPGAAGLDPLGRQPAGPLGLLHAVGRHDPDLLAAARHARLGRRLRARCTSWPTCSSPRTAPRFWTLLRGVSQAGAGPRLPRGRRGGGRPRHGADARGRARSRRHDR